MKAKEPDHRLPDPCILFKDLQEEYFHTNLRELIGLMKRQKNKEELRKYCKDNEERISRMDASAYDMICIMLNREDLLEKKMKY